MLFAFFLETRGYTEWGRGEVSTGVTRVTEGYMGEVGERGVVHTPYT
jgi:hypothetical protein